MTIRLHNAKVVLLLGLFFYQSTSDQLRTCVLAQIHKQGKPPEDKFPQNLQRTSRLRWYPLIPPIREEVYDPLAKHPGGLQKKAMVLKRPRFSTIPEEGGTTGRPHLWLERSRFQLLAGLGGPPITRFAYQWRRTVTQP
ncbi:uncharacterized protein LOC142769139 [Rhipicephalus microplus]|uniref:uncharacterized protein LOC142769139 n=1 Tax=Rhipicephalus microplus TaxID=6941 RepID=UPI003F6CFCA2